MQKLVRIKANEPGADIDTLARRYKWRVAEDARMLAKLHRQLAQLGPLFAVDTEIGH